MTRANIPTETTTKSGRANRVKTKYVQRKLLKKIPYKKYPKYYKIWRSPGGVVRKVYGEKYGAIGPPTPRGYYKDEHVKYKKR